MKSPGQDIAQYGWADLMGEGPQRLQRLLVHTRGLHRAGPDRAGPHVLCLSTGQAAGAREPLSNSSALACTVQG